MMIHSEEDYELALVQLESLEAAREWVDGCEIAYPKGLDEEIKRLNYAIGAYERKSFRIEKEEEDNA